MLRIYNARPANDSGAGFSQTMQDIADAMSVYVRQDSRENNSEPALGEVRYSTVCVEVRWAWIAYPVAIAMLTLLSFACAVIQAKIDQLRLQKANEGVATPFHDFKSSFDTAVPWTRQR
jgi:hypothetical protein